MRQGGVLIVTLVASLLSACAPSPIKITPEQRNQFKNHPPLTVAYFALPPFRVYTKGEAIGGFMGGFLFGLLFLPSAVAINSSDDDLQSTYQLNDPTKEIESQLVTSFTQQLQLTDIRPAQPVDVWDSPARLRQRFEKGMSLEVQTLSWGLDYTSWSRFHVKLIARVRLVNLDDETVLWSNGCTVNQENDDTDPTLEQFKANNGALIKVKLQEATHTCITQLSDKLFGRAVPSST